MRRPRWRKPNKLVDVVVRCNGSDHRFVPTEDRTNVLGFWFAKALALCPGVAVRALCQMSSHIHLVLFDRHGELSRFFQYALGHGAKAINRIDHVRGHVLERRYAEIEVLDAPSLVHRIAYAICNPVEANLVRATSDWTGLCLFAGSERVERSFTVFHEGRYNQDVKDAERKKPMGGDAIDKNDYIETATLVLEPIAPELAEEVAAAVAAREAELQSQQKGVLGMARVLATDPFHRPRRQKRTRMPLCFGATLDACVGFAFEWRAYVHAFREASNKFRAGLLNALFPAGSFRPSTSTATTVLVT